MATWPGTGAGRDPRRLCGAPDPFDPWNGLGEGNTRGYQYGQNRDKAGGTQESGGFSLGGFVRDTLTGAVIGGLGSAGFYGAGRAVEVLRGSIGRSKGGSGDTGDRRTDFYVTPSGDAVPSVGYRYSARNTAIIQNARNGFIEARDDGMYFSFDKIDDSIIAQGKLQIPYRPEHRISFDTLNIIDDINIPKGKWGTASYLEPITKDYRNFGPGGATQMITHSEVHSIMEIFKLR